MSRFSRLTAVMLSLLLLMATLPVAAGAQRRAAPRHPPHTPPAVSLRGHIFIGGYFYDPFFGPYPWWPRAAYPHWYEPIFDRQTELRLHVEPKLAQEAAVYVDGFYAGIVDDFNGVFQALVLTPGGHTIVLYLDGYRTVRRNLYLRPGSTFGLRETMQRLLPGESSEAPDVAPPVPAPPPGTYREPVTPPRDPRSGASRAVATVVGTLDLYVQPAGAEVTIDGHRWVSSDGGHFIVQVPAGMHHIAIHKPGHQRFATDVEIRAGEMSPLNVSLTPGTE